MTLEQKKQLLIASMALVCFISFAYWLYGKFYLSTDDAYVNANVIQVAPRVSGQITHLYVTNNQFVKAGDVLFEIDAMPYQYAYDQANAQLDMNLASLKLAQVTAARTTKLEKNKFASQQENDSAQATLESATASVKLSQANAGTAKLNLNYTKIIASTSGWITNLSLREGDIVNANQPQFVLISNNEFWIDANFKETELSKIKIGQRTNISVDMYPNHLFHGVIESISGGSGTAFSLLPPENATGNWVKVTQRVPVRVKVLNTDEHFPLRIGTTANVSVHIHPWF